MRRHLALLCTLGATLFGGSAAHAQAAVPTSVTFNPTSIRGGLNTTGVVQLDRSVSVNTSVSLTVVAGKTGVQNIPTAVTVAAGSSRGVFGVVTRPTGAALGIQVRATLNTRASTGSFTILPPAAAPVPSSISYSPSPVVGGGATTGTLTLDYPAPAAMDVRLQVVSGAQYISSFPPSVRVPAGSRSASFPVGTAPVGATVQANTWAYANGGVLTQLLTIQPGGGGGTPPPPPPPPATTPAVPARVAILPTVIPSGGGAVGVVTLTQPAPTALTVSLAAVGGGEAMASLPPSVTIPAGAQSAHFPLVSRLVLSRTLISIQAAATGGTATGSVTATSPFDGIVLDPALPRVLLIGDSISIGYTFPVRGLLQGRANVLRIGENGGPTSTGLARMGAWIAGGGWDVIHFNFGLHDLKRMPDGSFQVSVAQYEANLRTLVQQLKGTGARLVFSTTTPIPEGVVWQPGGDAQVRAYNDAARRVMQEQGVTVLDLYHEMLPFRSQFQASNDIHFSPAGYEFLATRVASTLKAALEAAGK